MASRLGYPRKREKKISEELANSGVYDPKLDYILPRLPLDVSRRKVKQINGIRKKIRNLEIKLGVTNAAN